MRAFLRRVPAILVAACACGVAPGAFAFKMEAGALRINGTAGGAPAFTARAFQQTYAVAPVVIMLTTSQGTDAAVVRVQNVTTTGFEAVVVESPGENGITADMDVHYFAIEPGRHVLALSGGGTVAIEAGILPDGTTTPANTNGVQCGAPLVCPGTWTRKNFSPTFTTTPVVLTQLLTTGNPAPFPLPAPPRPFLTAIADQITATGFRFALDMHEVAADALDAGAPIPDPDAERIGYVAIQPVFGPEFAANNAGVPVRIGTIFASATVASAPLGWDDGCTTMNFGTFSSPSLLVLASKASRIEGDGGWLRRCALGNNSVGLTIDEDTDAGAFGDRERQHDREAVSLLLFSRAFFFDSAFEPPPGNTSFRLEADRDTLDIGVARTITFRQTYAQPPAVFALADAGNPDPTAIRVLSVTTTGFTVVAVEPTQTANRADAAVEFHYLAIEQGINRFPDGTIAEVGETAVTAIQHGTGPPDPAAGETFQTITLATNFGVVPAVLTQIAGTANPASGPDPRVPWLTVALDADAATASSFPIALERSEVDDGGLTAGQSPAPERVFYLAVAPRVIGDFVDNQGVTIQAEANRSAASVSGWADTCFDSAVAGVALLNVYATAPLVVAAGNSHHDSDGGWVRRCSASATHVRLAVDEDEFADDERSHAGERAGLMAFSRPFDADFGFVAWYEMQEPVWNAGANRQVDNTLSPAPSVLFDATPFGGATTDVATPAFTNGVQSTCRYGVFDGANDRVAVGVADFGFTDRLTVMAWVRWNIPPASGRNNAAIVQNNTTASNNAGQFWLHHSANNRRFVFRVNSRTNGLRQAQTANNFVNQGVWYHVAGVYDGAQIRMVVDGVLRGSQAQSGEVESFTPAFLTNIGFSANSGSGFRAFAGRIDEVRIYRRALAQSEIAAIRTFTRPCSAHDHYAIEHVGLGGGFGVTCEAEPVTITAHDVAHAPTPPPAGTVVTVSTAPPAAGWTLQTGDPGAFSDLGGGVARYTWNGVETAITLGLSQTTPATIAMALQDDLSIAEDPLEDPVLEFRDAIFEFSTIGAQIAGKPSSEPPNAQTLTVRAIETNAGTGACEALLAGPQAVEFAYECRDPATCAATSGGAVEGAAAPANPADGVVAFGTANLVFDAAGAANYVLRYDDAGMVGLHARKVFASPAVTLEGASNAFVSRPFGLRIAAARLDGTPNPAALDASGGRFELAGRNFAVTLDGVAWAAADDSSPRDGIADGHESANRDPADNANLGDNPLTGNYATAVSAVLGAYLYEPHANASGSPEDPGIGGAATLGNFSAGTAVTAGAFFNEVGIIELEAVQGGDYLGIGAAETANIRGVSGVVGRFAPAWFTVAPSGFTLRDGPGAPEVWGCPFTYIGQPFAYTAVPRLTASARTALGDAADNYTRANDTTENFFKFGGVLAGRVYAEDDDAATSAALGAPVLGTVTVERDDEFGGSFDLAIAGEHFHFLKGAAPEAPFDTRLTLTVPASELIDDDGVCFPDAATACNTNDAAINRAAPFVQAGITGTEQRFGRLVIANAVGSELLPLALPARVEYFADTDGSGAGDTFVLNTDDHTVSGVQECTRLDLGSEVLQSNLQSGTQFGDQTMSVGGGTTRITSADPVSFASGVAAFLYQAPGAGNTGFVDLTTALETALPATPPLASHWLQFDWDGDGAYDDDPTARAAFGLFPGSRELIYTREPWD